MRLLFLHGAAGYVDDTLLAHALADATGAALEMPRLPDADLSVEAWAEPIRSALAGLDPGDAVVGHSFGGTILVHVLAEGGPAPSRATLLAMPDWGPNGWDVAEYAVRPPGPEVTLTLHHCRDDEVVSFGHLALNAATLSTARVVEHDSGGHQFDGRVDSIAADLLGRPGAES